MLNLGPGGCVAWSLNSYHESAKMNKQKIGVIHPGMMGICIASTIQNSGYEVYWIAKGAARRAGSAPKNSI